MSSGAAGVNDDGAPDDRAPDRLTVGFLIYPQVTALDLIGPQDRKSVV